MNRDRVRRERGGARANPYASADASPSVLGSLRSYLSSWIGGGGSGGSSSSSSSTGDATAARRNDGASGNGNSGDASSTTAATVVDDAARIAGDSLRALDANALESSRAELRAQRVDDLLARADRVHADAERRLHATANWRRDDADRATPSSSSLTRRPLVATPNRTTDTATLSGGLSIAQQQQRYPMTPRTVARASPLKRVAVDATSDAVDDDAHLSKRRQLEPRDSAPSGTRN